MMLGTFLKSGLLTATATALLLTFPSNSILAQSKDQALEQLALTCWNKIGSKTNLKTFDDLDFNVFTNQKWDELKRSHAQNIIVHWPDGRTRNGIDVHIEDLKAMIVFAPDSRIKSHPIRIACGELTAVTGVYEGTFSKPMPIGNGKTIAPTGKPFKLLMATIGRWENGRMVEEWLFWDNKTFLKQIGLAD